MYKSKYGLMKILEIQNSYQKHKKRLLSIQEIDTKKKVEYSTIKNLEAINSFKRSKINSEMFQEKQKQTQLTIQNNMMHHHLVKVLNRKPNKALLHNSSKTSVRSICSSQNSRVKQQNSKLRVKIAQTKSTYQKFRSTSSTKNHSVKYKHQLVKLLQTQLGRKPKVVFPQVRIKSKKQDKSHHNPYYKNSQWKN